MASTLIAHVDCDYKTREQLEGLFTPEPTKSWKPIAHFDLATAIVNDLARRSGIAIVRERYAVGGVNDAKLFGTIDLRVDGVDDANVGTSIGIRAANDMSMKIQVIAAANVFVCDNMSFSGSEGAVMLNKKHTSGLEIGECVPEAIDLYLDRAGAWRADIGKMQDWALNDSQAKSLIYDAFLGEKPVMPIRLIDEVDRLYFRSDEQRGMHPDRSVWGVNNAFTEAVKDLLPMPRGKADLEIGKYFGRLLHRGSVDGRKPLPFESSRSTFSWSAN